MISYPAGAITPNQARRLIEGKEPMIAYRSYDDSTTFHLMGALSPIIGVQEGVTIAAESIKGLTPGWEILEQTGANQDGSTFQDAVYNSAEIDMVVEAHGVTPQATRRVVRDWIASWDPHKTGELSVFTFDGGLWWAPVRWLKAPGEQLMRATTLRQRFIWSCRIDDAFWRSYDSIATYRFNYDTLSVTFPTATTSGLGTNWPLTYSGSGTGFVNVNSNLMATWQDQTGSNTPTREVVAGPYKNFTTGSDNQVVSMQLGMFPDATFQPAAYNDLWARMGKDGSGNWNGYGVRARIGYNTVELSCFVNNVKTVMATAALSSPPGLGENWQLVCGYQGDSRLFRIFRNNIQVLAHKEDASVSPLGSSYRGVGFGMLAAGAATNQASPGSVRTFRAGVNQNSNVSGDFLPLTNIGDVEAWPRYLLYGPGTFTIGNGPYSKDTVTVGPLLDGQIVLLETEPRRRSIVDVTPSQLPSQNLNPGQMFLKSLITLATNNNVVPFLQQIESFFGILPPQGPLYSLMKGRFTFPIPAKSPGDKPKPSYISVGINGGNANSKVVAAITPRRRWPM